MQWDIHCELYEVSIHTSNFLVRWKTLLIKYKGYWGPSSVVLGPGFHPQHHKINKILGKARIAIQVTGSVLEGAGPKVLLP